LNVIHVVCRFVSAFKFRWKNCTLRTKESDDLVHTDAMMIASLKSQKMVRIQTPTVAMTNVEVCVSQAAVAIAPKSIAKVRVSLISS
jgi:hypothetical protein